ncbi:hypothetical protein EVAR_68759_1 [Eumeta japonica]|uniref:G-protein coupled receptors family 1 profile domain-containing protein n=1 Tax=Eumeta variegata TaxID=151549 RepID=A0A4C2ADX1_EUMVA|nr:hypothetical protein EVAR_68759_1 [Eumeta japonica]
MVSRTFRFCHTPIIFFFHVGRKNRNQLREAVKYVDPPGRAENSRADPPDRATGAFHCDRLRLVRERKRVAWILLLLAVLFAMCWLPYNIMQLLLDINVLHPEAVSPFLPYTLLLGDFHSKEEIKAKKYRSTAVKLKPLAPSRRQRVEPSVPSSS